MDRRSVLQGTILLGALGAALPAGPSPAAAQAQGSPPRTPTVDHVKQLAERLSTSAFERPKIDLPEPFNRLTYDQYRDIRFRPDQSIWRGDKLDYEVQLFPIGFLYDIPVDIWLVEGGENARLLKADTQMFSIGPLVGQVSSGAPYAFSGFRIHGPLNRSDYYDEFVVFQGASYFRGLGRNELYGMSARGLAINTARPGGEEFPLFRSFWIEKPRRGASEIVLHALLDSPSTTGAYRFAIEPGEATVMDIDMTLYPRKPMSHVGLAPLTSMFLHGSASNRVGGDFRPSVHDSEGLAIVNGSGERIWRPLTNPKTLQTSAFVDKDPKGFGLTQRGRAFHQYQDLEARYERRPSVWVEPKGPWGVGNIELIEIPTEEEIHDNIVAYWKPAKELVPGQAHSFGYRLFWTDTVPVAWTGAYVHKTFIARTRAPDTLLFVVDFDGPALATAAESPVADVSASGGTINNVVVQKHPELQGVRVTFELGTAGTEVIELRLGLKTSGQLISESWLYRWTRP